MPISSTLLKLLAFTTGIKKYESLPEPPSCKWFRFPDPPWELSWCTLDSEKRIVGVVHGDHLVCWAIVRDRAIGRFMDVENAKRAVERRLNNSFSF